VLLLLLAFRVLDSLEFDFEEDEHDIIIANDIITKNGCLVRQRFQRQRSRRNQAINFSNPLDYSLKVLSSFFFCCSLFAVEVCFVRAFV